MAMIDYNRALLTIRGWLIVDCLQSGPLIVQYQIFLEVIQSSFYRFHYLDQYCGFNSTDVIPDYVKQRRSRFIE